MANVVGGECILYKSAPPMGGVSYSVADAGRLPVSQQRGWEGRVLGATRRRIFSAVEGPGTVWSYKRSVYNGPSIKK